MASDRAAVVLACLTALPVLASCGAMTSLLPHKELTPAVRMSPAVENTGLPVAVYFSEKARGYRCDRGVFLMNTAVDVGAGSTAMFTELFGALFQTVDAVESPERRPPGSPLMVVDLLEYRGCSQDGDWSAKRSVSLGYEAVLHDGEGSPIWRWEWHGGAGPESDLSRFPHKSETNYQGVEYLDAITTVAMRRAAADFIINFEKARPEILDRLPQPRR